MNEFQGLEAAWSRRKRYLRLRAMAAAVAGFALAAATTCILAFNAGAPRALAAFCGAAAAAVFAAAVLRNWRGWVCETRRGILDWLAPMLVWFWLLGGWFGASDHLQLASGEACEAAAAIIAFALAAAFRWVTKPEGYFTARRVK